MPYNYIQQPRVQGNSFYNPYMPGPDIGQGVPQLMQQLMQIQMYKQQREKEMEKFWLEYEQDQKKQQQQAERWQKEQKHKEEQLAETIRHHKETEEKSPPARIQEAQKVAEVENKTVGEVLSEWRQTKPPKLAYRDTPEGKKEKLSSQQHKFINTTIQRYTREKNRLATIYTKTSDAHEKHRLTKYLINLQEAIERLSRAASKTAAGEVLIDEEWKRIQDVSSKINDVREKGIFNLDVSLPEDVSISADSLPVGTQTATNTQTGEKIALINGKWIKIK